MGLPALQVIGNSAHQVHVDTISFSVSGAYNNTGELLRESCTPVERREAQMGLIAIIVSILSSGCWP